MRILIVEDEPLIAMDLEDIITEATEADCVWARTVPDGLMRITEGVDFALLDFDLGDRDSVAVAVRLRECHIPFCFVSGRLSALPAQFGSVPRLAKPFRPSDVHRLISGFSIGRC